MNIEREKSAKKQKVPIPDRWEIVHHKKNGLSGQEVSDLVGWPKSTCNAIYSKWQKTHDVVDLDRSGRPKKITDEIENMLQEEISAHPNLSLNGLLEESKVDICKTSARTTLNSLGFYSRISQVKWSLDKEHRAARLTWAKRYIKMPEKFWFRVIFTDESKIQNNPNKQRYWLTSEMEIPTTDFDRWGTSAIVWGCISWEGILILEVIDGTLNSDKYLNILRRRLLRNFPTLHPKNLKGKGSLSLIYQQDGATSHTSNDVLSYFEQRSIELLPWPAKSPDLNPMESVWAELKGQLKTTYQSREKLIEDIINVWESIQVEYIQSLYQSMRRRIQAVIDAEGGPTKY